MKFICLGYADMSQFAKMPAADLKRAMDDCFDYDDVLRGEGHFAGGEALEDASTAITLRFSGGRVEATDGPFAETKEQLGGILILEADSMEHAVELMSKHPGVLPSRSAHAVAQGSGLKSKLSIVSKIVVNVIAEPPEQRTF